MIDNRFLGDKLRLCLELFRDDCRGRERVGDILPLLSYTQ